MKGTIRIEMKGQVTEMGKTYSNHIMTIQIGQNFDQFGLELLLLDHKTIRKPTI